jgi:hypothetical protein
MRVSSVFVLVAILSSPAFADPPDDTLQHYLSKSDYALAAEVVSEPKKVEGERQRLHVRKGQTAYGCKIKVTENFHYKYGPVSGEFTVTVVVWGDAPPLALKKGQKCIFFIANRYGQVGPAATSDPWFGVQPYNAKMAELLKEQGKRKERPDV